MALSKEESELLIEQHWAYVDKTIRLTMPYDSSEWSIDDLMALVEHSYKSAFAHGIKHTVEAYEEAQIKPGTM